jgi:uncharacterized protein (TIGR00304 family)
MINLLTVGIVFIITGFILLFLALLVGFLRFLRRGGEKVKTDVHGGAVVMIGPFPIVLASDPKTARMLILLAIILTVMLIVLTLASYGMVRLG